MIIIYNINEYIKLKLNINKPNTNFIISISLLR